MVDVGVSQQHEIQASEVACIRFAIAAGRLAASLEHSAVDDEAQGARFDQQAGAGHFAGRTHECQSHLVLPKIRESQSRDS